MNQKFYARFAEHLEDAYARAKIIFDPNDVIQGPPHQLLFVVETIHRVDTIDQIIASGAVDVEDDKPVFQLHAMTMHGLSLYIVSPQGDDFLHIPFANIASLGTIDEQAAAEHGRAWAELRAAKARRESC